MTKHKNTLDSNLISKLEDSGQYKVLRKVPEHLDGFIWPDIDNRIAVIDLETTGLDYTIDKITEIGIIVVDIAANYINEIKETYQSFNDPGRRIPGRITHITGIDNEMTEGQTIDWGVVNSIILKDVYLIVCHNASFDRKFLEAACPLFAKREFACTKNDIDWDFRGYSATKLDYLNWKLGYFYDGHRALNDCWATLNLLVQEEGALAEMTVNASETTFEIYATDAPYYTKDKLKEAGFYWNDGNNGKPKAWFSVAKQKDVVLHWLSGNNVCKLPQVFEYTAKNRYSIRG